MRYAHGFAVAFAAYPGASGATVAPGPVNLLDLSLDAYSTTTDQWITSRNPLSLLAVNSGTAKNTSRGGWSFASVLGVQYILEWDYSPINGFVFDAGTSARVTKTSSFGGSSSLIVNGGRTFTGSVAFTGTGEVIWIGPALVCPEGTGLQINKLLLVSN